MTPPTTFDHDYTTDDVDLDAIMFTKTVNDILRALDEVPVSVRTRARANLEFHYYPVNPIGGDRRE